jgi:multiple sugar transport system ATP-binding protein|tara:strand:- start:48 stop:1133 length:1086 start_codon:yes stop_codon:yes gene_type:complete
MEHVELKGVTKRFGAFEAISDLNLSVKKGEFCALLGPSGCGKSTLLRLIAGLEILSAGKVHINDKNVSNVAPAKRSIAMVFQSYALYPHMSVRDNIAFSLDIAGVKKAERLRRADEIAKLLQLEDLMDRRPSNLSGGQRQRVAIGRALIRNPEVFLFDEPLSNLDAKLRVQMRLEIAKLHQNLKVTMIYVTHDQVEAMTLADKVVVLDSGCISQFGAPLELYHRPANKFVASFIGSPAMNFIPVLATAASGSTVAIELANQKKIEVQTRNAVTDVPTGPLEIGVRPENLEICAPDDPIAVVSGTVQLLERLGSSTTVYVETLLGLLCIQTDSESLAALGDTVGISFDISRAHLFSNDGQAI